jgi:hypothetical protein
VALPEALRMTSAQLTLEYRGMSDGQTVPTGGRVPLFQKAVAVLRVHSEGTAIELCYNFH